MRASGVVAFTSICFRIKPEWLGTEVLSSEHLTLHFENQQNLDLLQKGMLIPSAENKLSMLDVVFLRYVQFTWLCTKL